MDDRGRTHRDALNTLIRGITRLQGDFSLILACCNYRSVRETIVRQLRERCPVPIRELTLDPSVKTLYTTIFESLQGEETDALMVFGLESVHHIQEVLKAANQMREEFRNFEFPFILWVNDRLMSMMIRSVPDFHSFATTVHFEVETDELIQFLRQATDRVIGQLLDSGAAVFLDEATLQLESGSPLRTELELARRDLQRRGVAIAPELEGNLELVLGRVADNAKPEALEHYEKSLALWRRSGNLLGCGHVLFYLGFWWRYYAMMHRGEKREACQNARNYYRDCLEQLEAADRPDLAAKFINAFGEVLLYLGEWDELEGVANRALDLHRRQGNPFRTARAYHFLAEVELARHNWKIAGEIVGKALEIVGREFSKTQPFSNSEDLRRLDWEKCYHWGWYLLCLGRSQWELGRHEEAIATFKNAKNRTKPAYDPELYISILRQLHDGYFNRGEYLKAYRIKQHRREIEQQFQFRPFIGAGALRESRAIGNPGFPKRGDAAIVNPEIAASGRFHDIEKLLGRIGEDRCKLTVIYGQSGVGKSSLLQAGLIPKLKHKSTLIQTRRVLPIYQKIYTNWIRGLSGAIASAWEEMDGRELDSGFLRSPEEMVEQIRAFTSQNLLAIVIFDQFEEFFVSHKEPQKRQEFYRFLRDCLDTPYVKIVLSLRQDYLHHLLEGNRRKYFESVNDNILDKNILYYLGNFLPEDAKSVIQSLTEQTQFILQPELIDRLVEELAGESGEVRPIELQVVGSQLYAKDIKTLEKYEREGPNRRLVESYLEEVVADCGSENKDLAELVLYLLTDEHNNRPLKTRYDLSRDLTNWADYLNAKSDNLDAVLTIFVQSGLVCLLPEIPEERYQLVHDYLVSFIREQRSSELVSKLEKEKRKREQAEKLLNAVLKQQLKEAEQREKIQKKRIGIARLVSFLMAILTGTSILGTVKVIRQQYEIQEKTLTIANSNYYYLLNQDNQLEALTTIMSGSKSIKKEGVEKFLEVLHEFWQSPTLHQLKQENLHKLWGAVTLTVQERDRLQEHSTSILSVNFSPDGRRIVSGGQDNQIRLWNSDGQLEKSWEGHGGTIWCVTFSPDSDRNNQIIASAGKDGTIKLWKLDGMLIETLQGHTDEVKWVSFSPDGKQLASASRDGTVRLWNRNGEEINLLKGHEAAVLSVSFSPDGQLIASSDETGVLKLWNRQGQLIRSLKAHEQAIWSVSFSPDSQFIASASDDSTVKLWNRNGTLYKTLNGHRQAVNHVTYSPDSRLIATASTDTTIKLWTHDGTLVSTIRGHNNIVNQVDFFPQSGKLVSASKDGSIRWWDIHNLPTVFNSNYQIYNAVFSSDGQSIVSVASQNRAILWNASLLTPTFIFKEHEDIVNNISLSQSEQLIASASDDKTVKIWNYQGEVLITLDHESPVWTVSFSPDSQLIASASNDRTIRLWDRSGTLQHTLKGHTDQINDLSFSPDGKRIVSVGTDTIKIWDSNGTFIRDLPSNGRTFSSVVFSPTGELLAVATMDGSLQLWTTSDWQPIQITSGEQHNRRIFDIGFNSNGDIIASASEDGTVKLWDKKGHLIATLEVGSSPVLSVSFSPDNQTLVATDKNNRMLLWHLDYGSFDDIDTLLQRGCNQLKNYLRNENLTEKDKQLCQGIEPQI